MNINYKVFAHLWEYYMTGAFGEEIVQYKGFQTVADIGEDEGRRVYLGAYRYRAGGELQIRHDGTKVVNFTDNNGSVRLVVDEGGGTQQFDYKPFGDTLWTSTGTMNRDNFDGSTYDSESDLQMLGFRMYDNETGRFTTPDLLWSAFPTQTPYHYAYISPLTYRDPSGLAPEKEKEGEELLDLNPDYLSGGYEFGIWNANEIERYNGMVNFWNDMLSGLDATFGSVMAWNDAFNTNYGGGSGGSGGRTGKGGGNCEMWMQSPGNKKWADLTAEDKNEVLTEPNALLRQKTNECESGNEYGFTICEIEIDGINYIIATNFHEGKELSVENDFNVPSNYSIVGTAHTHGKNSNGDHSSGDLQSIYITINSKPRNNINIDNFSSVRVGTGKNPQNHILQIKDVKTFQQMGERNYDKYFSERNKYNYAGWSDIIKGNLSKWGLQFNSFPKTPAIRYKPSIGGGR